MNHKTVKIKRAVLPAAVSYKLDREGQQHRSRFYGGAPAKYIADVTGTVLDAGEIQWLDDHGPIRIAYLRDNPAFSGHDAETGELIGTLAGDIRFAETCLDNKALGFEMTISDRK